MLLFARLTVSGEDVTSRCSEQLAGAKAATVEAPPPPFSLSNQLDQNINLHTEPKQVFIAVLRLDAAAAADVSWRLACFVKAACESRQFNC